MKIISANRSDVFNEYANIISNYNKKRILKEAGGASDALEAANRTLREAVEESPGAAKAPVTPPAAAAEKAAPAGAAAEAAPRAAPPSPPTAGKTRRTNPAAAAAAAKAAADAAEAAIKKMTDNLQEILVKIAELAETIKKQPNASLNTVVESIGKFEKNLESLGERISEVLEKNKGNPEVISALKELSKKVENLKPVISEAKETASRFSLSGITEKLSAANKIKNLISGAIKISLGLVGANLLYDWYQDSGETSSASGSTGNQGYAAEPPVERAQNRSESFRSDESSKLRSLLMNPDQRRNIFNNLELSNSKEKALESLAEAYDSIGFFELDTPVVVNNELIKYVFPSRRRGARLDSTRIEATKEYFSKVYSNPSKYGMLISRLKNESGSNDSQEIANYAFSTMAATGMFSGKGSLFGDRGQRYGRGQDIKSKPGYGMSGGGRRRLTRQERRLSRQQAQDGSTLYDNISDPIEAFAAGKNEFFNKKINNSTNKINNYDFAKKADETSNHYFKDAIQDLDDDEFMKAYYAGFSKLYDEKDKVQKPDYKNLYDLHDETGSELIHSAHPKAISVAEAIGDGGLVENVSESSKKMEEIAFRNPSGNYRARYAFIRNSLKKKS